MDKSNNPFLQESPLITYDKIVESSKLQHKENMDYLNKKFERIRNPLKIRVFLNHLKDSVTHIISILGFLKYLFSFYKYKSYSDFVIKHNVRINRMRSIIKYLEIKDLEKKMATLVNRNRQRFKEDSMDLYRNEANEEFYIKLSNSLKEKIINANRQSV